ncbi:hypothetical protein ABE132_05270 [Peribacillus simplex]|uniref:hypothetical protein n=1 Tax=Peribacillus simplex TaxID=1478 RepID=UPI003D2CDEE4
MEYLTESSSYESSSTESSSDESSSTESSSSESSSTESSSDESSSTESSENEGDSNEGDSNEILSDAAEEIENSAEGEENGSPRRVNVFKKMWLENMIKASKGIYNED